MPSFNARFEMWRFLRSNFARNFLLAVCLLLLPAPGFSQDKASQDKQRSGASQPGELASKKLEDGSRQSAIASQAKAKSGANGKTQGGDASQGQAPKASSAENLAKPLLPALDPVRMDLAFKSLYFTTVPLAALVLYLMLALHFGRPESKASFEPFFGQGQTTQLVVIIMVAGNVCSLAIAGVLGGSEVAAIYGGIVGYILGKKSS